MAIAKHHALGAKDKVKHYLSKLLGQPAPALAAGGLAFDDTSRLRRELATRYLSGTGIEIGALHSPLPLPPGAKASYVDRMSSTALRRHFPELSALPLINVDVIDDGESLARFRAGSQDFIIANHFIEHTQNPIATIERHLAVLKAGGVLFMAVPDKHLTYDRNRQETTFAHLLRDYREGPAWSYDAHLYDYSEHVDGCTGQDLEDRVRYFRSIAFNIHFHVWSAASLADFLGQLHTQLGFPLKVEEIRPNAARHENICILRRTIIA